MYGIGGPNWPRDFTTRRLATCVPGGGGSPLIPQNYPTGRLSIMASTALGCSRSNSAAVFSSAHDEVDPGGVRVRGKSDPDLVRGSHVGGEGDPPASHSTVVRVGFSTCRLGAVAAALIVLVGCGDGSDWMNRPVPPFPLGVHVGDGPPSPPNVEILQPAGTTRLRLKPRERMACVVRLTYPGSGTLPSVLRAVFRDAKGAEAGSFALEPREQSGQSFTLGGRLKAPAWPGRFRLQIDLVAPPEQTLAEGRPQPPRDGSVTTITAADVEVRR